MELYSMLWMGGRLGGEWIHVYVWLSPFAVHLLISYACVHAKSPWSCPILCDPMDYRSPGSSVHGIFQARTLKWVAISFSRGSSQLRDWTCVSCISCIDRWILYQLCHLGSPWMLYRATKESYINQCSHISEKKKFLSQWRLRTRIITFFQLEKFNKWLPQSIILLIDLDFNIIPVFEKLSFLLIQRLYE